MSDNTRRSTVERLKAELAAAEKKEAARNAKKRSALEAKVANLRSRIDKLKADLAQATAELKAVGGAPDTDDSDEGGE